MPLFFLASGIAAALIHKASRRDYIAGKLVPIAWIFLVWSVILSVSLDWSITAAPWAPGGVMSDPVSSVAEPKHGLWFVQALWVMCLMALLVRGMPPVLVLVLATAMTLHNDIGLWPRHFPVFADWIVHNLLDYTLFFFAGLFGSKFIISHAASVRTMLLLLAGGLLTFASLNIVAWEADHIFSRTQTLRAAAGVAIGLSVSVLVSQLQLVGFALSWFGQRSLGVFLGHGLFMVPVATQLPEAIHGSTGLSVVMPLALTVFSVAGSILLYLALSRIGLKWLYVMPKHWVGRASS